MSGEQQEVLEVAAAMEQRRALAIAEEVANIGQDYKEGPFRSGFATACAEIIHRLRTEVWDGCLPPIDAK